MRVKLYTVFVAEYSKCAEQRVNECLTCYGGTFSNKKAALDWVLDDIFDEIQEAEDGNPDIETEDIGKMAKDVFESGEGVQWAWENCDYAFMWKLAEHEVDVGGA